MSEWREVPLGEVLTLQRGFDLPARERSVGRFPIVSSAGVTGCHSEYKVDAPGVVIGRYGSLGSVHWIDEPFWPLNTALWVKDFKGNDERFVSYLLKTVSVDGSTASAVPGVNRNHLHRLPVRYPPRGSQRRIAAVLSAFDHLIEINERRIELLEGLARSLYREWFVRFRFPGGENVELVDSELGPIPVGWEVRRLREIADLRRQNVVPSRDPDTTFEHFSIPAFDVDALPVHQPGSSIKSGKHAVKAESVLLSKINPRLCRVWFVKPLSRLSVASTEFLVWTGTQASNAWLWSMFTGDAFQDWLVGIAGGTSTSHQRVKPGDLIDHSVVVAPGDVLEAFDEVAIPSLHEAHTLRRHNRHLAATRDLLLPRLVTGRLDISDVDLGDLLPAEPA